MTSSVCWRCLASAGSVWRRYASWEKQKDIKEVMVFLQGYDVSTAYAAKIYRQYQKDAIKTVKENPYKLADDIWGIGFKTTDGIASKMGYENNDPRRCRSGILYTPNQLAEEGHVFAEPEQLVTEAKELLQADEEPVRKAMAEMIAANDLIADNEVVYLLPFIMPRTVQQNDLLHCSQSNVSDSYCG